MFFNAKQFALAIGFGAAMCFASQGNAAEEVKPDNTKVNERDRNGAEVTADQSKQNKSDVELAANIRKAVVKDDTLSTNAHNVKIIAIDGIVTLKGPVKNDGEKMAIEKIATSVAGDKNVKNQIDIAP